MALVSLTVGAIARMILPGRDPSGVIITILLGLGGSATAEVFGRAAGWYRDGESATFVASVVGATVVLALYRALLNGFKPTHTTVRRIA
jgi:uncharacterized membrane protein YeaQ/YmgE (transglycosylase-associated protein family)